MRRTEDPTRERGTATVEFALVLPLVMIMVLALVQVGLFLKDQLVVQEAARAGAREAAVTTDDARASQAAIDAATGLDRSALEVTVAREGGGGTPVTVSVLYHAPTVVPVVDWLLPEAVDLSGAATMRQESG